MPMTDAQVEVEIARLMQSEYVKLAKKEARVRNRRRQYMCSLRCMERRGKDLAAQGITIAVLDALDQDIAEEDSED